MLQLTRIDDPRDNLERARLMELRRYAEENGVEIPPQFLDKAIVIRKILRGKGLTRIPVPSRTLGQTNYRAGTGPLTEEPVVSSGPELDAADDLMRQALTQPPAPEKPRNEITELRRECKRRGIKIARTDKLVDLKAKLDGENLTRSS